MMATVNMLGTTPDHRFQGKQSCRFRCLRLQPYCLGLRGLGSPERLPRSNRSSVASAAAANRCSPISRAMPSRRMQDPMRRDARPRHRSRVRAPPRPATCATASPMRLRHAMRWPCRDWCCGTAIDAVTRPRCCRIWPVSSSNRWSQSRSGPIPCPRFRRRRPRGWCGIPERHHDPHCAQYRSCSIRGADALPTHRSGRMLVAASGVVSAM